MGFLGIFCGWGHRRPGSRDFWPPPPARSRKSDWTKGRRRAMLAAGKENKHMHNAYYGPLLEQFYPSSAAAGHAPATKCRTQLEAQVAAYLARGGKITIGRPSPAPICR